MEFVALDGETIAVVSLFATGFVQLKNAKLPMFAPSSCRSPHRIVVSPAKAEKIYYPETFGRTATDFVEVE